MKEPIFITGIGLCTPDCRDKKIFVPRLNNAYEQEIFQKLCRISTNDEWYTASFDEQCFHDKSSFQDYGLRAVEKSFDCAFSSAKLSYKLHKNLKNRVAVIYFNSYGNTSFLKLKPRKKDILYLDFFPSYILEKNNIKGYAVKLLGERNTGMEALNLAYNLLCLEVFNIIIVGGLCRIEPYLTWTDLIEFISWEKGYFKKKPVKKSSDLVNLSSERCVFLVLEREFGTIPGRHHLQIQPPVSYNFLEENSSIRNIWDRECSQILKDSSPDLVYGGFCGSTIINGIEREYFSGLVNPERLINLTRTYGDSSGVNILFNIHDLFARFQENGQEVTKSCKVLFNNYDRNGTGWHLECNIVK